MADALTWWHTKTRSHEHLQIYLYQVKVGVQL